MIDYGILADSIEYYESKNFKRIEVPWTVSPQVENITRPENAIAFELKHTDKCLVASGEQGFLYLYLKGFLPKGQFQAITPCYRFESFDFLHTKYFIKNELIKTDEVTEMALKDMVHTSLTFFQKYIPAAVVTPTEVGYDIVVDGMELGSYGIRRCEFLTWIYGTGVAEPRLSSIKQWLITQGK